MEKLNNQQEKAFESIRDFVQTPSASVFILKGYAGTGKTTLVKYILEWMDAETEMDAVLLASTGRAAKILEDKTGFEAYTVHSHIFSPSLEDDDQAVDEQLVLNFDLRPSPFDASKTVYVIDEASMLSHLQASKASVTRFGSGNLLADLFQFVGAGKVIFVGDPLQLPPPVGNMAYSPALDNAFLQAHFKREVMVSELTDIMRQREGHAILDLATELRQRTKSGEFKGWEDLLKEPGAYIFHPSTQKIMIQRYLQQIQDDFREAVILTHSNKQAHYLNIGIRKKLQGKFSYILQPGELLMVSQNSYYVDLANGDQVKVVSVKPAGKRAGFMFLDVEVEALHNGEKYQTYLIKEFLFSPDANLKPEDSRKLIIDFDIRARKSGIRRKTKEYMDAMRNDKYLNALRAKFGYAITCHKSQGGEWPHVFLNLSETLESLPDKVRMRWLYTAVTRARDRLDIKPIFKGNRNNKR